MYKYPYIGGTGPSKCQILPGLPITGTPGGPRGVSAIPQGSPQEFPGTPGIPQGPPRTPQGSPDLPRGTPRCRPRPLLSSSRFAEHSNIAILL